jgi:hypothetical protein
MLRLGVNPAVFAKKNRPRTGRALVQGQNIGHKWNRSLPRSYLSHLPHGWQASDFSATYEAQPSRQPGPNNQPQPAIL